MSNLERLFRIFPKGLVIFSIILMILVPLILISVSGFAAPFFVEFKGYLPEENIYTDILSKVTLFVKLSVIIGITGLIFLLFSLFLAVLTYNAYEETAQNYLFKRQDFKKAVIKALNWNFYRLFYISFPILSVLTAGIILFILLSYFFNQVLFIAGINLNFVTLLSSFVGFSFIFSIVGAILLAVWNLITTVFGMECAVSEPDLSNNTIRKRSEKLLFIKPNTELILYYSLFSVAVISQIIIVIFFPDIINEENLPVILIIAILDIALLVGLVYFKAASYVNSLLYQFNRIVAAKKRRSRKNRLNYETGLS